jgi:hypothetical protein
MAMSRKEMDMERALKYVSLHISLSNPFVDEDIGVYIQLHLQQDADFGTWPAWLKAETEAALIKKANGMYVLIRCRSIPIID